MNNNKLYKLLIVLIATVWVVQVNAQVTIGATSEPHAGAVLDLKSNTSRGLLMPQVVLASSLAWTPLEGTATDGMTVYNTSASFANGLKGPGIYVWIQGQWGLVSNDGGTNIGTSCAGVFFNIALQNAPAAACAVSALPTTIKVVASTSGSGTPFTYGGDFNADGTLKSGILMPSAGPRILHVKITDTASGCNAEYDFVIPQQTSGCPPLNGACPSGAYPVYNGVYDRKGTGYLSIISPTFIGPIFAYFMATGKNLCVYKRDANNVSWNEANSASNGCATGGGGRYVDDADIATGAWRLPNLLELAQLEWEPSSYAFRDDDAKYWTSTEYSSSTAWTWSFENTPSSGYTSAKTATTTMLARCVRTLN